MSSLRVERKNKWTNEHTKLKTKDFNLIVNSNPRLKDKDLLAFMINDSIEFYFDGKALKTISAEHMGRTMEPMKRWNGERILYAQLKIKELRAPKKFTNFVLMLLK